MTDVKPGVGRAVLAVLSSGMWVGLCEFARNQLILAAQWQGHYRSMGLEFPAGPVNGMTWMAWSFLAAGMVFAVSRRFGLWATALIVWIAGHVMMWLVIWNLSVLPLGILPVAVPLSFLEPLGAAFICRRLAPASR